MTGTPMKPPTLIETMILWILLRCCDFSDATTAAPVPTKGLSRKCQNFGINLAKELCYSKCSLAALPGVIDMPFFEEMS